MRIVLRRAAVVVLGLAVLSASGMPLRLPCCSLRKLEATTIQSDCCPIPGCTLAEKQGAAPASLREAQGLPDPMLAAPAALVPSATLPAAVSNARVCSLSPSPPLGRSPSLSLLSVYRI
jgi:hypothetical protein